MQQIIKVYNSLTRQKEIFEPINPPFVGMYVCGPTVYGDAHLGHARPAITFDVVFRYLSFVGYKVRYVRNITDVGHLENDADSGEDKIGKKAKLEQIEPMEIVQRYTDSYHRDMDLLNIRKPSIEPRASGHIMEQIEMTQKIIDNGYAYISNGSVYFDVLKYDQHKPYGILSGRTIDETVEGTRELDGQEEKRNKVDFALWKQAPPEHIMRWNAPWSVGFPGWHIECSAMSRKYLGDKFDIHGGGMDLMFPHHEAEIAQSEACNHVSPAKYWLHNNMITINGQKMGKSLGNFINLQQLFSGNHALLEQGYSPMTIRFFILQSHYRSTLDFSNDALKAANKGLKKAINGLRIAKNLVYHPDTTVAINDKNNAEIQQIVKAIYEGMNDDFNTAVVVGHLFNLLKKINSVYLGQIPIASISEENFNLMRQTYITFIEEILGLSEEKPTNLEIALEVALLQYKEAKINKEYEKIDKIRQYFKKMGLVLKDMKDRVDWAYDEL